MKENNLSKLLLPLPRVKHAQKANAEIHNKKYPRDNVSVSAQQTNFIFLQNPYHGMMPSVSLGHAINIDFII